MAIKYLVDNNSSYDIIDAMQVFFESREPGDL